MKNEGGRMTRKSATRGSQAARLWGAKLAPQTLRKSVHRQPPAYPGVYCL